MTGSRILPSSNCYKSTQFPVIYRQHIYFPSSISARNLFIENPLKYVFQNPPGPSVALSLFVIGPPKSGKTTSKGHNNCVL